MVTITLKISPRHRENSLDIFGNILSVKFKNTDWRRESIVLLFDSIVIVIRVLLFDQTAIITILLN